MKTTTPGRRVLAAALISLTALGAAFTTEAATITWGSAQNIVDDNDVNLTGNLVGAVHANGPATTVNGVLFQSGPGGPFTLAFNASFNSAIGAPISAAYNTLLFSGVGATPSSQVTLTMSGLTLGQNYLFQWWSNAGGGVGFGGLLTTAGGAALDANVTDSNTGLGQFQIGTFIADNATQQIVFDGAGAAALGIDVAVNAFQLRQTAAGPVVSAVPEPGSALVGLMVLGLCATRLGRRQRPVAA